MTLSLWIDNFLAYSLQMAILAAAGTLLVYLFRLRVPRVSLIYWQVLLLACLLLPILQKWEHPTIVRTVDQTSATVEPMGTISAPTTVAADPAPIKIPTMQIIILTLASGSFLRMLWLGLGLIRLHLYLRRSEPVAEALPDTGSLSSCIGVKARFFISDKIKSPATFGIFTPTVLLPREFPEMSEECRQAIICHELLHVRRRDWVSVLLEELVRTLFWFHPAVWWLLSRIHLAREQAVDMEAVKLMGNQKPYLNSLLEIARMHGHPKSFPAPLFLRERHLVQRVALLVKEVSMNRLRLTLSLAGIAFLLSGTVLMASGWFPLTGPAIVVQEEIPAEIAEPEPLNTPAVPEELVPTQPEPTSTASQGSGLVKMNGGLVLNVKDLDLRVFIQQISELLALSPLIIDPEVQGSATVHSSEPMPEDKVLAVFHQVLRTNNASLIKEDGVYRVVPISSALKTGIDTIVHKTPEAESMPGRVVGSVTGRGSSVSGSLSGSGIGSGVGSGIGGGIGSGVASNTAAGAPSTSPNSSAASEISPKQISGSVLRSKLIRRVDPEYPELARRARVQDVVILMVTVDEEGNVVEAEPVRGHELLKDAAVDAVKQWKYQPTLLNGTPIPVTATVTVNFILSENPTSSLRSPQKISGSILESKLIRKVDPEYPEAARNAHVEDTVVLSVTVNEEGSVVNIETLRGTPLFIASAVEAVRQWKYSPTLLNGAPIPVTGEVTVRFVLKDDSSSIELVDPDSNLPDYVIVKFDGEGEIYINDIKTAPDNFRSILREKMGGQNTVFIKANPDIPFSMITDLVNLIRAAGAEKVSLVTKGKQE